jgi:long-chain-fatty-acid--CoA ligase ACSBG
VKPTFFFSVPRVWEKIEEKMRLMASQNGAIKSAISGWAKGMGKEGTFAELHGKPTPMCFGLAKTLVYKNVKKALGLDEAKHLMFGAAPLATEIREYFLSLNLFLINGYGMSECAGAHSLSDPKNFDKFD